MPRASRCIQRILPSDTRAFRLLWNAEHVPRNLLGIGDRRLCTYQKMGLVKSCVNSKNEQVIMCTKKGRNYLSKLPDFKGRYPYISTTASKHNCELARIIAALPDEEQKRWVTERELGELCRQKLEELQEKNLQKWLLYQDKDLSPCDGAIMAPTGDIEYIIEITTDNYGNLDEKVTCGQVLEAPIQFVRV